MLFDETCPPSLASQQKQASHPKARATRDLCFAEGGWLSSPQCFCAWTAVQLPARKPLPIPSVDFTSYRFNAMAILTVTPLHILSAFL